jgi:tripartite ATP-independent transporter DctM subunit
VAVNEVLSILMAAGVCVLLVSGFPVAFTLAGAGVLFAAISMALGQFDVGFLSAVPQRIYGVMTNEVLIAIPLFIFMGVMLERSKVADDLLQNLGRLFGPMRGGLGVSVILVGALMAASTGIVGATVVTMGLLSLPTMMRYGYNPALATGLIAASGTLAQIIPPSIVLVLLGDVLSASHQQVQLQRGIFSPETISVSDLFAGALIPGLLLVLLYILFQLGVAWLRPASSPAVSKAELESTDRSSWSVLATLIWPIALIIAVLGSILAGIATPTEAAAVGALGAVLLAGFRLAGSSHWPPYLATASLVAVLLLSATTDLRITRVSIPPREMLFIALALLGCAGVAIGSAISLLRAYRAGVLVEVLVSTAKLTSMIFVIIIAAAVFSVVFRALNGDRLIEEFLTNLPGGTLAALTVVMVAVFVLGFFLDVIEITYVVVPIVAPALMLMDVDPLWLGILLAINLQTSFLTPPFGLALFFLRSVASADIRTLDMYKGIVPFVVIQLLCLAIVAMMPELATWLPNLLFAR